MTNASFLIKIYAPGIIMTLMSLSSLILPPVDYGTRISIPVSTIIVNMFMYEEVKELGRDTGYWLMLNELISLAVVIEFVIVGAKTKYKQQALEAKGDRVDRFQLQQVQLSVTRSQLDRKCLYVLTALYAVILLCWSLK